MHPRQVTQRTLAAVGRINDANRALAAAFDVPLPAPVGPKPTDPAVRSMMELEGQAAFLERIVLNLSVSDLTLAEGNFAGLSDADFDTLATAGLGNPQAMADASDDDLLALEGIGEKKLERIRTALDAAGITPSAPPEGDTPTQAAPTAPDESPDARAAERQHAEATRAAAEAARTPAQPATTTDPLGLEQPDDGAGQDVSTDAAAAPLPTGGDAEDDGGEPPAPEDVSAEAMAPPDWVGPAASGASASTPPGAPPSDDVGPRAPAEAARRRRS